MGMRSFKLYTTRCTLKVLFMAGEDMVTNCIKANKAIFEQIKQVSDNKAFIIPWYENDKDLDNEVNISQFLSNQSNMSNYFPCFFIKKGEGKRIEYL